MEGEGTLVAKTKYHINHLGYSLLLRVMYHVISPPNYLEVRVVCKLWSRVGRDRSLWKRYFLRDFGLAHSERWDVHEWGGLRSGGVNWEYLYWRYFQWTKRPLSVIELTVNTPPHHIPGGRIWDTKVRLVTILDTRIFTWFEREAIRVWSLSDGVYLGELPLPDVTFQATTLACSESDHIIGLGDRLGRVLLYGQTRTTSKRKLLVREVGLEYFGTITTDQPSPIVALHMFRGYLATLSELGTLSLFVLAKDKSSTSQKIFSTTNCAPSQSPVAMTLRPGTGPHTLMLLVGLDIQLYDGTHLVGVQEFGFINQQLNSSRYLDVKPKDTDRATSKITCLAFGGLSQTLHLVSGHSDHTVHVWLVSNSIQHISTLFGHTGAIRCVAIDDLQPIRVISGSHDRRVKVWSLPTLTPHQLTCHSLLMTLDAHTDPITTLATKQDLRLVSGDTGGKWKLWRFDS